MKNIPYKNILYFFIWIWICNGVAFGQNLEDRVIEKSFKNGLKVLMVERHQNPTISFQVTYRVGSVNDQAGMTGAAHLYEHMAFKGTEQIGTSDFKKEKPVLDEIEQLYHQIRVEGRQGGAIDTQRRNDLMGKWMGLQKAAKLWVVPNELTDIYSRQGAVGLNASTGRDTTSYTVSLPANRLPLWIAIESDRMAHTVLREFYKEKEVVLEERRRSVETSPAGKLNEALLTTAFSAHPYRYPTLGWPSDVAFSSADETAAFFKTYYKPNNAIIVMVGDFSASAVLPQLESSFGEMAAGSAIPVVTTVEPPQLGEKRVDVEDEANSQLAIAFHRPGVDHPDDAAFDVIDMILSEGRTSRLYQKLVLEKKIATDVSSNSGTPGGRYSSLFTFYATPLAPHTPLELEEAIYGELERLKSEPPTPDEMEKVRTAIEADSVRALRSNAGLASQLGYIEAVAGSWRYILKNRDAIRNMKAEDVVRVVTQYFIKTNRTVATLVKKAAPAAMVTPPVGDVRPAGDARPATSSPSSPTPATVPGGLK